MMFSINLIIIIRKSNNKSLYEFIDYYINLLIILYKYKHKYKYNIKYCILKL